MRFSRYVEFLLRVDKHKIFFELPTVEVNLQPIRVYHSNYGITVEAINYNTPTNINPLPNYNLVYNLFRIQDNEIPCSKK